jgi:hypothetical protein
MQHHCTSEHPGSRKKLENRFADKAKAARVHVCHEL